jgi:hypothetical protein
MFRKTTLKYNNGHTYWCIICLKEYSKIRYKENKVNHEFVLKNRKKAYKYWANNKEEIAKKRKIYYENKNILFKGGMKNES